MASERNLVSEDKTITAVGDEEIEPAAEETPNGLFIKVEYQKEPIFVNIVEDTYPTGTRLQKRFQPTEKACYSHSPPDMKLETYNKKRHYQTFRKDHSLLFEKLNKLSQERNDPNYRPKPFYLRLADKKPNQRG